MTGFVELFTRYDVLGAFWLTIQLSLLGTLGALVIGLVIAICRVSPSACCRSSGPPTSPCSATPR
jgi:glutamate transport system permease protein